jgi:diphosphomevalonate decarboxylase
MKVTAEASPSLALIKYWGKAEGGANLPATSSLAVSLEELRTTTTVRFAPEQTHHRITIGQEDVSPEPFEPVINAVREQSRLPQDQASYPVCIESFNSFPTAAGIASSSSGFAALVLALDRLFDANRNPQELSATARLGSGSASRAVFGGFTTWRRGEEAAREFLPASHWPELRVAVGIVSSKKKSVSSRAAMTRAKETSSLYETWVNDSPRYFSGACEALKNRDLEQLGLLMQQSYLSMFSTMFTSVPPVFYWEPETVTVINACRELREQGVAAWETMDAGPQVKILSTDTDLPQVTAYLERVVPGLRVIHSIIGGEPEVQVSED